MRIAFVTTWDPHDPGIWAGTGYHIARALEAQGCELQYIGPLRDRGRPLFKGVQLVYRTLKKQSFQREREPAIIRGYAQQIETQLANSAAEAVFAVSTIPIAQLETRLPIAFWIDATYPAMLETYRWELPAAARSRRLGIAAEAEAMKRASVGIFSSDWAAQSALANYAIDPAKVKVVPFGANVQTTRTPDDVDRLLESRRTDRCRLLYIGTGWQRKGGDIAIEVARRLNQSGMSTELSLLGSDAPEQLPPFVKRAGYISKSTPGGQARFDALFGGSHFLILPARAEAFGVVLCEAGSYGVPAIATRVGGIPTIIRDGVNGRLFSAEDAAAMSEAIAELMRDRGRYETLARTCFAEYQARLNWEVAGRAVRQLIEQIV